VGRLPSNGTTADTVIFDAGMYPSGYSGTDRITTANLTLQGAAMPAYNSDLTALTGGTIITGTLPVGRTILLPAIWASTLEQKWLDRRRSMVLLWRIMGR
jgi:hypothetical protein